MAEMDVPRSCSILGSSSDQSSLSSMQAMQAKNGADQMCSPHTASLAITADSDFSTLHPSWHLCGFFPGRSSLQACGRCSSFRNSGSLCNLLRIFRRQRHRLGLSGNWLGPLWKFSGRPSASVISWGPDACLGIQGICNFSLLHLQCGSFPLP